MLPEDILADFSSAHTDPFHKYDEDDEDDDDNNDKNNGNGGIPYYSGVTGEIIMRMPGKARRVSRDRVRRLCSRGLDIRFGKRVVGIFTSDNAGGGNEGGEGDKEGKEEGKGGEVTIVFSGGDKATADLVIGADGGNSAVRRWLFGGDEEKSRSLPSAYAIANAIVARYDTAEQALAVRAPHPVVALSVQPGATAFIASMCVSCFSFFFSLSLFFSFFLLFFPFLQLPFPPFFPRHSNIHAIIDALKKFKKRKTTLLNITFHLAQDVKDPKDPTTFSFQIALVWRGETEFVEGTEAVARTKSLITTGGISLNEPFRSAILWMPPERTTMSVSQLHYWATAPWDGRGGRVTLAGDAAHCLLPSRLFLLFCFLFSFFSSPRSSCTSSSDVKKTH